MPAPPAETASVAGTVPLAGVTASQGAEDVALKFVDLAASERARFTVRGDALAPMTCARAIDAGVAATLKGVWPASRASTAMRRSSTKGCNPGMARPAEPYSAVMACSNCCCVTSFCVSPATQGAIISRRLAIRASSILGTNDFSTICA